jgi:hypothetical protein
MIPPKHSGAAYGIYPLPTANENRYTGTLKRAYGPYWFIRAVGEGVAFAGFLVAICGLLIMVSP